MLNKTQNFRNDFFSPNNGKSLNSYRKKIIFPVSLLAAFFAFPYALYHLFFDRTFVAIVLLAVSFIAVDNALAIYRKTKSLIPIEFMVIPQIIGMNYIIYWAGFQTSYWSFQTILLFYLLYSSYFANISSIILIISTTISISHFGDIGLTVRYFTSLTATFGAMIVLIRILEDLHSRLVAETITDPLTGVYNRRHLNTVLSETIARKQRHNSKASILLFDLDHFKKINDSLGHAKGDEILKSFAALIQKNKRIYDTFFRLGGEEFLLLLMEASEKEALSFGSKIQRMMPENFSNTDVSITVTIGVSEVKDSDTIDSWVNSADAALYYGKKSGRNRIIKRDFLNEAQIHISYSA